MTKLRFQLHTCLIVSIIVVVSGDVGNKILTGYFPTKKSSIRLQFFCKEDFNQCDNSNMGLAKAKTREGKMVFPISGSSSVTCVAFLSTSKYLFNFKLLPISKLASSRFATFKRFITNMADIVSFVMTLIIISPSIICTKSFCVFIIVSSSSEFPITAVIP
ncbi:hypothetical protein FF38_10116 [Lucilia cuprina]|uniref:Uncharacterized protein n=1 Tax=Lucilia cuprina TaxID=7375 RepID=A0A0L0CPI9_LUCCU|nr:hypothetical protein FF38_10116 [Lucilia cuprina]